MNSLCAIVAVFLVVALAADAKEPEICSQTIVSGTRCRGSLRRWGYSQAVGACTVFTYSGCDGNENNFLSEEDCQKACVCTQELKEGPCRGRHVRWGFSGGACNVFDYGGCLGNANNFQTETECNTACPAN